MSYTVLARKWRPQQFDEVVGQAHVTRGLMNALSMGRVAHAFLFSGTRGVGKTTTARILAKALNCESGPTPSPCGSCGSCTEITEGSSVDVMEIDAASNTSVENVREINENVRYAPARGRYKVYIIDEVHMLSNSAFNALLKTLEEPPDGSHVVLVTSRPNRLLPTMLSRCRAMSFQPLGEDLVAALLVREKGMPEDEASMVARMTGGRVGDALAADAADLRARREGFISLLAALAGKGYADILKLAEAAAKDGGLEDFVLFGSMWFRDVMMISLGGAAALAYNRDVAGEVSAWKGRLTPYRCEEALAMLGNTGRALERTLNRRLLAEDLFFKFKEEVLV